MADSGLLQLHHLCALVLNVQQLLGRDIFELHYIEGLLATGELDFLSTDLIDGFLADRLFVVEDIECIHFKRKWLVFLFV